MTERRRAIEVEDLQLVARWADLHGGDPMAGPGGRRRWDDGGAAHGLLGSTMGILGLGSIGLGARPRNRGEAERLVETARAG